MRSRLRLIAGLVVLGGVLAITGGAQGQRTQHWDRDVLTLKSGRGAIKCTILMLNDHGLSYSVGGKKARTVPLDKVLSFVSVNEYLTAFFEELDKAGRRNIQEQWALVEWAENNALPDMAKLQAYRCLGLDPQFEPAHSYLGHRKTGGGFQWRRNGRYVSKKEFFNPKRGRNDMPWFESPHFRVRSSRDILNTIGNIYDLERVRLDWKKRYHDVLNVPEYQEKLGFEFGFIPPRSTTSRPYFDPSQEYWFAYTDFVNASAPRPRQLFSLLTQQLLNSLYAPLGSYKVSVR